MVYTRHIRGSPIGRACLIQDAQAKHDDHVKFQILGFRAHGLHVSPIKEIKETKH